MYLARSLSFLLVVCFPVGYISVCTIRMLFDRNISSHTSLGLQSQAWSHVVFSNLHPLSPIFSIHPAPPAHVAVLLLLTCGFCFASIFGDSHLNTSINKVN